MRDLALHSKEAKDADVHHAAGTDLGSDLKRGLRVRTAYRGADGKQPEVD